MPKSTAQTSSEKQGKSALSSHEINSWWEQTSPAISRLTKWMDSKEDWVNEPDDEFISLLSQVIEQVESPEFVMAIEGDLSAEVAQLCAILSSSRFIRVLEMLDRRAPGIAARLVFVMARLGGENQIFADLYFERLKIFHRFELMSQVFSPQRCMAINSAIKIIKGS